jgi:toxin ParE1/3/4
MAYRIEFTQRALRDVDEAYEWIARGSRRHAGRWYVAILDRIETLRDHPLRCPLAPETESFEREIRQLLHGRRGGVYRVLFAVEEERVVILSVRHGARAPLAPEDLAEE